MSRLVRFALKPASEKRVTMRFLSRKALSKLPFVPIQTRFAIEPGQELRFWWSYISDVNHPDRPFSDYWGDDHGELRFLWKFLTPGAVFFDVGAYHGIFSLLAARRVGSHGRVFSFEPSPRERRRFEFHMRMNGIRNTRLEGYAVGAQSGISRFFTVTSGFSTMNSLQPPALGDARQIDVASISLDGYLAKHRDLATIDLIKIDVEGGELQAFEGAQHLLANLRPIMICEVLDWVTQPWGYPARQIVSSLKEKAYVWFDFLEDGRIRPHAAGESYPEVRNYLAVPREKLLSVERFTA